MNGIEKITGRIEADAREQASAITADAEAKCAEIRAGYDKQAQDQYWARVRDGVKTCEDRVQRMGRLAEMEARITWAGVPLINTLRYDLLHSRYSWLVRRL